MAISIGYPWSQRIRIVGNNSVFPLGCTLESQIRKEITSNTVLCTLTTENGGLSRASNTEVDIFVSNTNSSNLTSGVVYLDIIRTDLSPSEHLGFILKIPVRIPVTR